MNEGDSPLEAFFAQDKTQREFENHTRNHSNRVSLLQFQFDLQEGRHPICRYECLREEERNGRGVNDYKLLETRSNVSTWGSLLESRSKVRT